MQQHLGLLLALGGAEHALDSCKPGAPLRVSIDLVSPHAIACSAGGGTNEDFPYPLFQRVSLM